MTYHAFKKTVCDNDILTVDEENELFKKYKETGDIKYRNKILLHHSRLIKFVLNKFKNSIEIEEEMFNEGYIALINGIENYQIGETRFRTFVYPYITSAMMHYVLNKVPSIKLFTTKPQKKVYYNYKKYLIDGRLPNDQKEKMVKDLNVTVDVINDVMDRLNVYTVYLAGENDDDSEIGAFSLDEIVSDYNLIDDYDEVEEYVQQKSILDASIDKLNSRQKEIITLRWLTDEPKTLDELSQKFNVSKERIRQIEKQSIDKLKEICN